MFFQILPFIISFHFLPFLFSCFISVHALQFPVIFFRLLVMVMEMEMRRAHDGGILASQSVFPLHHRIIICFSKVYHRRQWFCGRMAQPLAIMLVIALVFVCSRCCLLVFVCSCWCLLMLSYLLVFVCIWRYSYLMVSVGICWHCRKPTRVAPLSPARVSHIKKKQWVICIKNEHLKLDQKPRRSDGRFFTEVNRLSCIFT